MTSPADLYDTLAADLATLPGVGRNSRGSLVVDGGVRAMTSTGNIVVKLTPGRTRDLVQAGTGRHYKDQPNAWLEVGPDVPADTVRELLKEALTTGR